jgi:hypothetical protein
MDDGRSDINTHFEMRLLPLPFAVLVAVILLVCISSPMYLQQLAMLEAEY